MSEEKSKKPIPDLGLKRSEFQGRHQYQKGKELYAAVREAIGELLTLPCLRNKTQREEQIRAYQFVLNTRDVAKLPYFPGGIGSRENNVFRCLSAEVANLVLAYWAYLDEPGDPAIECITDHLEYLDQLMRDPDTLCTVDLNNCRYRICNARIKNDNKMVED